MVVFEEFTSNNGIVKSFKGDAQEKVSWVTLKIIVLELVMTQKSVRGQDSHVDGSSAQMEDMSLRQANDIVINFGQSRLALFICYMFECQNFVHGHNHITKNVILGNDITVGVVSADNDKLMGVFIVPENFVHSFIDKFNMVVSFRVWVEKIDFAVLVLED